MLIRPGDDLLSGLSGAHESNASPDQIRLVHPLPEWWPLACLLAASANDVAYNITANPLYARCATWLVIGALILILPSILSSLTETPGRDVCRVAAVSGGAVVVLCIANLAMRVGDRTPGTSTAEFTLAIAAIGIAGALWRKRQAAIHDTDADDLDWPDGQPLLLPSLDGPPDKPVV